MAQFLFVYGTLRKGGVNHLPDNFPGSIFVGAGTVKGGLYDLGDYPGLLLDGSEGSVAGEVYEIEEATLAALDEFESAAEYHRLETSAFVDGRTLNCWVYGPDPGRCQEAPRIDSGDWVEHTSGRES